MSRIEINLLPVDYRRKRVRVDRILCRRVVWPTIALLVVIVLGVAYTMNLTMERDETLTDLETIEKTIASKQKLLDEIKKLEADKAVIQRKNDALRSIQVSRQRWIVIFENLSYVLPENTWITGIDEKNGRLEMTAVTFQCSDVAQYMTELQKQVAITNVRLKKVRTVKVAKAQGFEFSLSIGLAKDINLNAGGQAQGQGA